METLPHGMFFAWDESNRAACAGQVRDELLQTLTALAMDAGGLRAKAGADRELERRLADMLALLQEAVTATERFAAQLRPLVADPDGLGPALESLAAEFSRRTGAACELEIDESLELQEDSALGVFRTVQDWVRAASLDGPGPLRIRVALDDHGVLVQVHESGGVCLDGGTARARALAVLQARARLLGGSVRLVPPGGAPAAVLEARLPRSVRPAA